MDLEKLLTRKQLAALLELSPRTLDRWASVGGGPHYIVCGGGSARYRPSDVSAWLEGKTVSNSAQGAQLSNEDAQPQIKSTRGRPRKAL
jgi:predicted DNA-binding transcriptional regulator AlpA